MEKAKSTTIKDEDASLCHYTHTHTLSFVYQSKCNSPPFLSLLPSFHPSLSLLLPPQLWVMEVSPQPSLTLFPALFLATLEASAREFKGLLLLLSQTRVLLTASILLLGDPLISPLVGMLLVVLIRFLLDREVLWISISNRYFYSNSSALCSLYYFLLFNISINLF